MKSMNLNILFMLILSPGIAFAFVVPSCHTSSFSESRDFSHLKLSHELNNENKNDVLSRPDFVSLVASTSLLGGLADPAFARGRATLELSYDRYTPRINAGTQAYSGELKKLVGKGDFAGIKEATQEPPKRSKEDKYKADGGFADRAKAAGIFSDARVLVAADLYAAAFSDNSISAKTKNMQAQVAIVREAIQQMNYDARVALGEEKAGGGFFGIGAKQPSLKELAIDIQKAYVEGGNAWNQYILYANDGLPVSYTRLPFL